MYKFTVSHSSSNVQVSAQEGRLGGEGGSEGGRDGGREGGRDLHTSEKSASDHWPISSHFYPFIWLKMFGRTLNMYWVH